MCFLWRGCGNGVVDCVASCGDKWGAEIVAKCAGNVVARLIARIGVNHIADLVVRRFLCANAALRLVA